MKIRTVLVGHLKELGAAVSVESAETWGALAPTAVPTWRLGFLGPYLYPGPGIVAKPEDPPRLIATAPAFIDALCWDLDDQHFEQLLEVILFAVDLMIALEGEIADPHERYREIESRLLDAAPGSLHMMSLIEFRALDLVGSAYVAAHGPASEAGEQRPVERSAPCEQPARCSASAPRDVKDERLARQADALGLTPAALKRLRRLLSGNGRKTRGLTKAKRQTMDARRLSISIAQLQVLRRALALPTPARYSDEVRAAAAAVLRMPKRAPNRPSPLGRGVGDSKKKGKGRKSKKRSKGDTPQRAGRCVHQRLVDRCPVCGPTRQPVFITSGGFAFHLDRRCSSLEAGQDLVRARGGVLASIVMVNPGEQSQQLSRRRACRTCVR